MLPGRDILDDKRRRGEPTHCPTCGAALNADDYFNAHWKPSPKGWIPRTGAVDWRCGECWGRPALLRWFDRLPRVPGRPLIWFALSLVGWGLFIFARCAD